MLNLLYVFYLSEKDSPNRIELDSAIFDDKHFTVAAHSGFNQFDGTLHYFFSISKLEQ